MIDSHGIEAGSGQPMELRIRYPHMSPMDNQVWNRYIRENPQAFTEVWYDVRVGTAMVIPRGGPDFLKVVADGVSRKRIDVVGRLGGIYWIVEIKPLGMMKGLGQLITYRDLFIKEFGTKVVVQMLLLCRRMEVDLLSTARDQGISVVALDGILY